MVGAGGERAEASRILRRDLDRPLVGPLRHWVDAAIEVVAVGPYDADGVLGERVGERLRGTPADTSPSGSPSAWRRRRGRQRIAKAAWPLYVTSLATTGGARLDAAVLGHFATASLALFTLAMAGFVPVVTALTAPSWRHPVDRDQRRQPVQDALHP